ncbi:MAG: 5'/3'-nucleotidase SurE [Endomicrobium sp.]|jgi:5'-nucleotidase|nr:5'/3'-nucleotidase SurE [Endomicrobium sp.]
MYKILISNDDGVKGPGLRPLLHELSKIGKVYVIVPKSQMSGMGHGITLAKYKKVEEIAKNFYVIKGGTPADCVKYGLYSFLKDKIDLVVSGINTCPNLGQDVIYSGTVGAAREGALKGIPSLAISAAEMDAKEYDHSAIVAREISEKILKRKNAFKNICLNINVPKNYRGIKIVPLGIRFYEEDIETIIATAADKKERISYKLKLSKKSISAKKNKGTDVDAVNKRYISITPLQIDQTDFKLIKKVKL